LRWKKRGTNVGAVRRARLPRWASPTALVLTVLGACGCAASPSWAVISAASVPNPVMFGPVRRLGSPPSEQELAIKHRMYIMATPLWSEAAESDLTTTTTTTTTEAGQRFAFELAVRLFVPKPWDSPRRQLWEEPHRNTDVVCLEDLAVVSLASASLGSSSASLSVSAPDAFYFHAAGSKP
jgi:hypothetical protein